MSLRNSPLRAAAAGLICLPLLAGCGPSEPSTAGAPPSLHRLTQEQYKTVIADLFGADIKIGGRFEPDLRRGGMLAVGTGEVSVTPAGFEQYDNMARTIARQVVDERHRQMLLPCQPADKTQYDEACTRQVLTEVGRLLYRRPLQDGELATYVTVAKATATGRHDAYDGIAMGLAAMLEAPQFIFRHDSVEPVPGHAGQVRLDGYAKAARLSFFLWGSTPDTQLLAAAQSGEIHTEKGLARQVDRLLSSPRLENGMRAFFSDMLVFDGLADVNKDPQLYPKFLPAVAAEAREQTMRTFIDLLLRQGGDYRDLFTTRHTFMTRLLATVYRVPIDARDGWVPYEFAPSDGRAGLLGQVSFLAQHSHPGRSSPTIRGKAIREILLCQTVPDPPGNVDFKLVQDTQNATFKTVRARLTQHATDATCAGCHKIIDPIGLALEKFDTVGGGRETENNVAIDDSGEIDGQAFAGAIGLGKALHDNPQASSCVVGRLYAYGTGRAAGAGDGDFLHYLDQRFAADGHRLLPLLRRIATSDAFYRVSLTPADTLAAAQGDSK